MAEINLSAEAQAFLNWANRPARLLPQQLAELLPPIVASVDVDYEDMMVGGLVFKALSFVLHASVAGVNDLTCLINSADVLAMRGGEPMFRGEMLIEGVMLQQIRATWGDVA